jgi:hypothetical protein
MSMVSSNFPGSLEEIGRRHIASSMHNIHARIPPPPSLLSPSASTVDLQLISLSRKRELSSFERSPTFLKQKLAGIVEKRGGWL